MNSVVANRFQRVIRPSSSLSFPVSGRNGPQKSSLGFLAGRRLFSSINAQQRFEASRPSREAVQEQEGLYTPQRIEEIFSKLRERYGATIPHASLREAVATTFPDADADKLSNVVETHAYVSSFPQTRGLVLLHSPEYVEKKMNNEFLSSVSPSIKPLLVELQSIKERLESMQEEKHKLDLQALRSVKRLIYGSCTYLIAQMLLYARFTWYDFGWDIMEPVTYFTTFSTITLTYLYFLINNRDYTYKHATGLVLAKKRGALYYKNKFDIYEFERLVQRAEEIRRQVEDEAIRTEGHVNEAYKEAFFVRKSPPSV